MAGSRKKSRKPSTSSESGSEGEESDSGTYHGQKEIQVTFEGRNPEIHDFLGIQQLLCQLFLKAHIDVREMTNMLIAQYGVGSVLKQCSDDSDDDEEDEDINQEEEVYGITSVINLRSNIENPCVKQLFMYLESLSIKHADESTKSIMDGIIKESSRLGFLINERFVNIPAQISVTMLSTLYDEIQRVKKKDASYKFEYYIMICKTCIPKDKKGCEIYSNDEEEIFSKHADATFSFDVSDDAGSAISGQWKSDDKELLPHRRVLIFKSDKLDQIINEVSDLLHPKY